MDEKYWIEQLPDIAEDSDDPDTQTACIIVGEDGEGLAYSANCFPLGLSDLYKGTWRNNRPAKYSYIQHAERRALYVAATLSTSTLGSTAYLNWFPCLDCACALVTAGVSKLYVQRDRYEERKEDPRYGFAASMELLLDAKVELYWF